MAGFFVSSMRESAVIARAASTFALLFLFLPPLSSAAQMAPLAVHQIYSANPNDEVVIDLSGHNFNSDDRTTATVVSLPREGTLYQLSKIFNSHGYEPKVGTPITEDDLPCQVTALRSRVVYKAPARQYALGRWDVFDYTVSGRFGTSKPGTVTLTDDSQILVASDFRLDTEGWTTVGNKHNGVIYDDTSTGIMNRYVYSKDDSINVDESGNDQDLWRFKLPEKFTGWHGIVYGGSFEFSLSSFSGDFSPDKLHKRVVMNLVEISCSRCAFNKGITIGFPLDALPEGFSGVTSSFSLPLNETAGWLKGDPNNPIYEWMVPPTKCEIIEVLSKISSVTILGDFTDWYEGVSVDNIHLRASELKGKYHLPPCAQVTPDAKRCSCA